MTIEPVEITVAGNTYKVGKLTLRDSFELTRLVLPIIPVAFTELVLTIRQKTESGELSNQGGAEAISTLLAISEPVLDRIAKMPPDDFWRVVMLAMGCAERKVEKGWAKVVRDGQVMFSDIGTAEALRILWEVVIREVRPIVSSFGM